jgi:hypothetical protein
VLFRSPDQADNNKSDDDFRVRANTNTFNDVDGNR